MYEQDPCSRRVQDGYEPKRINLGSAPNVPETRNAGQTPLDQLFLEEGLELDDIRQAEIAKMEEARSSGKPEDS